ncbi:alanine racemase [Lentibacter sp. XHP0401]|uniref:alanine racemase n=1 Tax=Lentibacter sp. XHP0401 TaxID=2984334 RepID=UPI0021E92BC5|nr:alanine racemase [Lentibacter sp. XHP0401]MCV2891867.1 alanine racemase [Lentibacter sp. XHP0401]
MASGTLTVDLDALVQNWQNLGAFGPEAGAVVKADAYGLGVGPVARALAKAGARKFFVATSEEGATLRRALGDGPEVFVFSGHMAGDSDMIADLSLTPMLNSIDQLQRHMEALPKAPFGIQLDTGMNRLGMEPAEWAALGEIAMAKSPALIMSHLSSADEPQSAMNILQLRVFKEMTAGLDVPRSLAATGGTLLGSEYHFDLTRPGIGMYGGAPYTDALPVAYLELPVIQIRDVEAGESVGYNMGYVARQPRRVATLAAGYADGLIRAMSSKAKLFYGQRECALLGRVSMDLITVDITHLTETPASLTLLGRQQSVDTLAAAAGTIGYEILTSLGARYTRRYSGG